MSVLNNLPPFYVGQKVVRIKTNKTHTVLAISKASCECWLIEIDSEYLGDPCFNIFNNCTLHGSVSAFAHNYKGWISYRALRPLESQNFPLLTLSKIKEKEQIEILTAN